jgi:fused signal recognition particle receptor
VRQALHEHVVSTFRARLNGDPIPDNRPVVLLVVGVNGAGKTTSIAKLAHAAQSEGRRVVLAAADTFRAGAIEQVKVWGDRLNVPVVAQQAGSDPGAVAYDAMAAARARNADLVIVDTAGRLHTKHNLMEEIKKVRNIVDRQGDGFEKRVLLVIDGTTGQNGLAQAKAFTEAVRCDGVMLTKLDGTAKGGIALAIAGELGLPVWFAGTGEKVSDISEFDPAGFADAILPETIAR